MKAIYKYAFVGLLLTLYSCGPTIYLSPDFDQVSSKHKSIAILPFDVQITSHSLPKDMTAEKVKMEEEKTGYAIQGHSYTYFLKEMSKKKYSIRFQDIDKTNSLLKKAGLDYDQLKASSKEELCRILDVDVVLSGKATMDKPMSDGGAIAVGVLFGVWTSTNKVNTSLTIHEAKKGDLLWKYDWTAEGSVGSNSESLTKGLMKNASKKFPYQKK